MITSRDETVLFVNPFVDEREMFTLYLEAIGFHVLAVDTAESALKLIVGFAVDAVVSRAPLSIRGSESLALAREIRSHVARHIPLVLLTTDAFTDLAAPIRAGYDLVLLLPVLPDDLAAAIGALVDRTRDQSRDLPADEWTPFSQTLTTTVARVLRTRAAVSGVGRIGRPGQ